MSKSKSGQKKTSQFSWCAVVRVNSCAEHIVNKTTQCSACVSVALHFITHSKLQCVFTHLESTDWRFFIDQQTHLVIVLRVDQIDWIISYSFCVNLCFFGLTIGDSGPPLSVSSVVIYLESVWWSSRCPDSSVCVQPNWGKHCKRVSGNKNPVAWFWVQRKSNETLCDFSSVSSMQGNYLIFICCV